MLVNKIDKIKLIDKYVRGVMSAEVAHDVKHVHRVRNWALQIAREEHYNNLEIVEAAALLHDVGLLNCHKRSLHGEAGAEMANKFLKENNLFFEDEIGLICEAIKYHNSNREGEGDLLFILRDADMMDMFGAVGIMRALTSKATRPEYNTENIKGETWGLEAKDFDKRFDNGEGIGDYIVDQINFQISCFDNLKTKTARRLARPMIEFMKNFLTALEKEIMVE
ncbi:MAG: HD domain-containing protein [Patescibacteria group bacterium]|nr:HD domain-containing protein [Patescibacteria group bacterium]MDD5490838.1 HD domain-containing protein [Patescibacteria group bacterium]